MTVLVAATGAAVAALLAWRAPQAGPSTGADTARPEVVNERGLVSRLLNLQPKPLADCAAVREWLEEHPKAFLSTVQRSTFKAELRYRPASCAACLEMPDALLADADYQQRRLELAGSDLYLLRIMPGAHPEETPRPGFNWQARIEEVVGGDTIPCAFVHVETLPPGIRYQNILLGFEAPQDTRDRQLIIRDPDGALGGDLIMPLPTGGPYALAQALNPSQFSQP